MILHTCYSYNYKRERFVKGGGIADKYWIVRLTGPSWSWRCPWGPRWSGCCRWWSVYEGYVENGDKCGDVGTVDEKSLPDQARSHGSQYPPPSPFLLGSTSENSPCSSLFKELTYLYPKGWLIITMVYLDEHHPFFHLGCWLNTANNDLKLYSYHYIKPITKWKE